VIHGQSSDEALSVPAFMSVCWELPAELLHPLRRQAELESVPVDVVTARVLAAGLIELGWMPFGRCSVRTGLCGGGPVPLPIQQQSSSGEPI
jgi:hypothetical protein